MVRNKTIVLVPVGVGEGIVAQRSEDDCVAREAGRFRTAIPNLKDIQRQTHPHSSSVSLVSMRLQ